MTTTAPRPPTVPPRWVVHTAWRAHRALYKISGGRFLWSTSNKRGWGALRLTTVGRTSGQDRSVIIGYVEDGPDLVAVGTLAEIIEVQPYDDGASDLLAVGSRRFRLCELITEGKPYLRASVEWIEESDGALSPAHIGVTRRLCRDYAELFEALSGRAYDEELPTEGNLLSYHVAGRLPLPQSDRQAMLEERQVRQRRPG